MRRQRASLASCEGKLSYATFTGARKAATSKRREQRGHVYRCACGGWHVGTGPARPGDDGLGRPQPRSRRIEAGGLGGDDD